MHAADTKTHPTPESGGNVFTRHTSLINFPRELIKGLHELPDARALLVATPLPGPLEQADSSLFIADTEKPQFISPVHGPNQRLSVTAGYLLNAFAFFSDWRFGRAECVWCA